MPTKQFWIMSMLLACAASFLIDEQNYFYLNSSYSKQTISFSMCFKLTQPAQITLTSPVLIPQGNHSMVGMVIQEQAISFANAYDSQFVLYNSYGQGEHWFGIKVGYQNVDKYGFVRLEMHLKQENNQFAYVFLAPLFRMPLNAILISPTNTLSSCHKSVLTSYLHKQGEIDFYAFGDKNLGSDFKVAEKKDWGFYQEDAATNYLRHKSKSRGAGQLTFKFSKANHTYECKVSDLVVKRNLEFQGAAEGYRLDQLLQLAEQMSRKMQEATTEL